MAAAYPELGIGFTGVALAFGLTVVTMAYAIGHISGCHLNPAVSVGFWVGGRFDKKELLSYIIAQVLGELLTQLFCISLQVENRDLKLAILQPMAMQSIHQMVIA